MTVTVLSPLALCALLAPGLAHAAAAEPSPWLSLLKLALALGLIVLLIVLVLGLMRRLMLSGMPGGQQPLLRMRGGLMVGQRERVVVLEIEDTWLVVGITGTQMTLLHSMPRGELPPPANAGAVAQQWLDIWRKYRPGGRDEQ